MPIQRVSDSVWQNYFPKDSALNVVISEIRNASTSGSLAWISQPGLVRTFDNTGQPVTTYKLYSSGRMVISGSYNPAATPNPDLPASTAWMSQPNLWTDINSPIASGTSVVFPIIDGNGMKSITMDGTSVLSYSTDGVNPDIQGFSANTPTTVETYNAGVALSATNNPVPMPVQWLYMLKDGTLIPAAAVNGSKDVSFASGLVQPTGTNPIVARVAFWTDDDTNKVDINTAAEGTYWDTPVCNTQPFPAYPLYGGSGTVSVDHMYEWDLAIT